MIDDPDLRRLFKAESGEHIARLDDGLLRLEKTPTDQKLLEELFRESHSLKGAARMLGLSGIETSAHDLESVFNAARKGEALITPKMIEQMNSGLAVLRERVQTSLAGEGKSSLPAGQQAGEMRVPEPPATPEQVTDTSVSQRPMQPSHLQPYTTSGEPQSAGASSGHVVPQAPVPPQNVSSAPQTAAPAPSSVPSNFPPPSPSSAADGKPEEPFRIETVRVETRKLDELLNQVGELSVIQGRAQHRLALMEELLELWAVLERGGRRGGLLSLQSGKGGEQAREADAMARFGELLKKARSALFDDSSRLESTGKRLEDQVRSIRLLPLSNVFALFPRMVRDLAKEQNKEVELVVEGSDITADKRILEEMKDPLMHLIRNAVDHGIEPPDERERQGKPRRGKLWLCAARENANVLLTVRDDGRGLSSDAIRQAAQKRGVQSAASLADMSPEQLQQLIFLPGFSTSAFVTELSGRGVGLDVVRSNVEHLKGDIQLESAENQGLAVRLRLPLSLTTTRILLASAGGRPFGLPVEFVQTSRRVRESDLFTLEGRSAVLLDTPPVLAAHLAHLLELPATASSESPETLACIILQVGNERLALLTDELLGEEEVVPKALNAPLQRVRNVSGLAMLGSGEICPVLNPADLLRSARNIGVVAESGTHEVQREGVRPSVLLVEDSSLIRAMEKRILEDGGYEVVTAVDGLDALNVLGTRTFNAIVSDIMMPNMDGLSLTERVRAEPRYKELPVILVTSLASDEDKRRGLEVGASAYIPKPSFDQRVLMETLKRLVVA